MTREESPKMGGMGGRARVGSSPNVRVREKFYRRGLSSGEMW